MNFAPLQGFKGRAMLLVRAYSWHVVASLILSADMSIMHIAVPFLDSLDSLDLRNGVWL